MRADIVGWNFHECSDVVVVRTAEMETSVSINLGAVCAENDISCEWTHIAFALGSLFEDLFLLV